ncbi:uncharacterized protein LOC110950642 [Acanthochromis polyacanthus]|uniref:uncharacterized protein LOC110950642 n=1 Tax=Acanthochromis polyacanthus TaxID=80966 RepID=UPI0022349051|nr:uncharacterized protein LOC110950642 [Acanthochromis polyacanthus]
MAFANLFANLAPLNGDVKSPGEPAFTHPEETAKRTRSKARKRKAKEEQPGSYIKKQRCEAQTTTTYNFKDDNIKARGYHTPSTDSAQIGNHSDKAAHNIRHSKGQNYKSGHNCEVNKQKHQKKKMKWQKNQHEPMDKWTHSNRGGRAMSGKGERGHRDIEQMRPPRFMTQEFKDQNVLTVDGRLICRHFLYGRCIKGDSCQLEHVQGYNDLIKSACKFYIQGFCTKGESCPYMHKSFPCKFFHTKGKCFQGADCKFSHEPLNNVTNRLLEEALKRDSDLSELTKKGEQESSGEQPNTPESEITEATETPDLLTQPLRPNFYHSRDAAKETLLCTTGEQSDVTVEVFLPHASDAAPPQSPPSTSNKEPVCYSVEAVLGPQLSRPFPRFSTAPGSQGSTSLSVPRTSSDATLDTTNPSEAPYSVDAVLKSFKSVEKSPFGQTSTTTTVKTVSYTPKTDCERSTDPLLNSQHEKILLNTRDEANKSQQKMFKHRPSVQMHTGLISKTCHDLLLTTEDHKNQCGNAAEFIKTAQRTSNEVKLELLGSPVTQAEKSASSQSKGDMKDSLTCPPAQLKPHLSGLTSDLQSSTKPFSPSAGFSEFKGSAKVQPVSCFDTKSDSSDSPSHHFAAKQGPECGLKLGTLQLYSAKMSPERSNEMTVGCKKNQKKPFHSLFANPISDSVMSAHSQGFIQTPRCADFTSKDLKTAVEPDKPPSKSFLSLFAVPLIDTAASAPCSRSQADDSKTPRCRQKLVDDAFHLSKRRASSPCVAGTDATQTPHRPTSPNFSASSKTESASQPVNPVCRLMSDSLGEIPTSPAPLSLNPSIASAQQLLPDISSPRDSVLKSLFLSLSPYQEDRLQRDSIQISRPTD